MTQQQQQQQPETIIRFSSAWWAYLFFRLGALRALVNGIEDSLAITGRFLLLVFLIYCGAKAGALLVDPNTVFPSWLEMGMFVLQLAGLEGSIPGLARQADTLRATDQDGAKKIEKVMLSARVMTVLSISEGALHALHVDATALQIISAVLLVVRGIVITGFLIALAKVENKAPRVLSKSAYLREGEQRAENAEQVRTIVEMTEAFNQQLAQTLASTNESLQQRLHESSTQLAQHLATSLAEVKESLQVHLASELAEVKESLQQQGTPLEGTPEMQARFQHIENAALEGLRHVKLSLEKQMQQHFEQLQSQGGGLVKRPERPTLRALPVSHPQGQPESTQPTTLGVRKAIKEAQPASQAEPSGRGERSDSRAWVFRCLEAEPGLKLSEIEQKASREGRELSQPSISRYRAQFFRLRESSNGDSGDTDESSTMKGASEHHQLLASSPRDTDESSAVKGASDLDQESESSAIAVGE